jgi:hypothetical protein
MDKWALFKWWRKWNMISVTRCMAGKQFILSDEVHSTNYIAAVRIPNSNLVLANAGAGRKSTKSRIA